jgi:hypothetical protein
MVGLNVNSAVSLWHPTRVDSAQFHVRNRMEVVSHAEVRHESDEYGSKGNNEYRQNIHGTPLVQTYAPPGLNKIILP